MANFICGVRQGSTLGPLLFLYTNDLSLVSNFETILFVNDTVLLL